MGEVECWHARSGKSSAYCHSMKSSKPPKEFIVTIDAKGATIVTIVCVVLDIATVLDWFPEFPCVYHTIEWISTL